MLNESFIDMVYLYNSFGTQDLIVDFFDSHINSSIFVNPVVDNSLYYVNMNYKTLLYSDVFCKVGGGCFRDISWMIGGDMYNVEIYGKSNYYIIREYISFTTPEAQLGTNRQFDLRCWGQDFSLFDEWRITLTPGWVHEQFFNGSGSDLAQVAHNHHGNYPQSHAYMKSFDIIRVAQFWDYWYNYKYNYHIFPKWMIIHQMSLSLGMECFNISNYTLPYYIPQVVFEGNLLEYYDFILTRLDKIYSYTQYDIINMYYNFNSPTIIYWHIAFFCVNFCIIAILLAIVPLSVCFSIILFSYVICKCIIYIYYLCIRMYNTAISNGDRFMAKQYDNWDLLKLWAREYKKDHMGGITGPVYIIRYHNLRARMTNLQIKMYRYGEEIEQSFDEDNVKKANRYYYYNNIRLGVDEEFVGYFRKLNMYFFNMRLIVFRLYGRLFIGVSHGLSIYVFRKFMRFILFHSTLYGIFYLLFSIIYIGFIKIYDLLNDRNQKKIVQTAIDIKNRLLTILFFTGNFQFFRSVDFYAYDKIPYYLDWRFFEEYPDRHDPTFYRILNLLWPTLIRILRVVSKLGI